MARFRKNFILAFLAFTIALNPLLTIYSARTARAEEGDEETESLTGEAFNPSYINIPNQKSLGYSPKSGGENGSQTCKSFQSKLPDGYYGLSKLIEQYSSSNSTITFSDLYSTSREARLVMPKRDIDQIKTLVCLEQILPNYELDFEALSRDLPKNQRDEISSIVAKEKTGANPRFSNETEFFTYLQIGTAGESKQTQLKNRERLRNYIKLARESYSSTKMLAAWDQEARNIGQGKDTSLGLNTLSCVTGKTRDEIRGILALAGTSGSNNQHAVYLQQSIQNAIASLKIDVRVLKTLVYLITPKNQGGAGHWRVRVRRLTQTAEKSNESDASLNLGGSQNASTANCTEDMTAAECGRQNNVQPTAEITDKNGDQYDAYLTSMESEEDKFLQELNATEKEKEKKQNARNVSAHHSGQAIDVSELDDIRCTKIKVPNTFLGGKVKKTKQPIRPVKLAWQTQEGWNESGGMNDYDMMGLLRSMALETLTDFFDEMGDPTSYDGDITTAGFDDIIELMGRSILGQLVNSPGHNLNGYSTESTLKSLGSMYF
ncbi:MAG TPA: hypothetical protein PK263_04375, partial [bacterium]|nr:hypothetical protein [bacterium]